MSTVIFFNLPAHCHTNPTLPLVTELIRRGDRVIYYSHEDFRPVIEQTGASFRSYGSAYPFDHTRLDENIFTLINKMMQASLLILDTFLDEVKAAHPDYIIHDSMCPWGNYFAQILGIPSIRSIVIFAINMALALTTPFQFMEHVSMSVVAWKDVVQTLAIAGEISKKYRVKRYIDYMDIVQKTGAMKILYTSAFFQPFANQFDDSYKFIGYPVLPRAQVPAFPFEALTEKPLLYISLGTVYNEHPEFYQLCFAAFAQSNWQVVISIGSKVDVESLGTIPANFIVRNVVPQLEILQRGSLFISAGGSSSVKEACYYGVPLIVIPHAADQAWVARRVDQLGAGRMVRKEKVTAPLLRRLAAEIIANPQYAKVSAKIGASLQEAGGYERAIIEIEQLKRTYLIH
jgi:MGT family glycosyltransferase